MKPKRIFVYTIFLIISFQNLAGQKSFSTANIDLKSSELCLTGELFTPDQIIEGTTYFNSEWLPGDIYLSNGEVVRNKLIKYNGLLDELFWQEPKSKNVIKLDKESILQFHFQNLDGDSTVYFRKIKVKKNAVADSSEFFGQVVYEGSLSLFVLHIHKFEKTELFRKDGVLLEKNVYAEEPVYIFRYRNNKTFITRKLNRNSLIAFSPENKNKIVEFLKENGNGIFTNKPGLIMLTRFLGTLKN